MFENYQPPQYDLYAQTGERLSFGVYQGSFSFTIFGPKGQGVVGRGVIATQQKPAILTLLRLKVAELCKNANTPGWKTFFTKQHRDFESKKNVTDYTLGFSVDDQLICSIEVRIDGKSFTIPFRKFQDVSIGTDTMTPSASTMLEARAFGEFLSERVPLGMTLTAAKLGPRQGNNQPRGSRGGQAPASQPPPSVDDTDMGDVPF